MPLDRFYERKTVIGQLKQKAIEIWPTVYKALNSLLGLLFEALRGMIESALNAIQGK